MIEFIKVFIKNGNKSKIANVITSIRILCSIALLFNPVFSWAFYLLYIIAGLSDMIDGTIARKTNSVSEFGSKLDTIADIIFVSVCLIELIPIMNFPFWLYVWIISIGFIKLNSILYGYIKLKEIVSVHSFMNKITGLLLFIFPLTVSIIPLKYSTIIICIFATVAAIQEGYYVKIKFKHHKLYY
ncbi:Phosphatidylglycerophosphate synthase [Anaeromyces robustus]|uniref:Phosphatidylglycerophosphate synthase n=1 Tax=Anaeromyces robustus TaxID=1754192 RepID=A0A1Y1X536_9FUNG|nr:Phosphatidylglycerophosphate synthase [Anaeromyces robustus]|eukprot:ORX80919.1 Phosphatidylglycerophosphate synthase [Anaeromyces robustus]